MDRERLTELLKQFRCADGCDALSAKSLGELRDLLVAYQAELEESGDDAAIDKIAQTQTVLDEVSAAYGTAKAEFDAKVAAAKGVKSEAVEDAENADEEIDISEFQSERPATAEDGSLKVAGKVMIATGRDPEGKLTFDGEVGSSLELTKALQRAMQRYSSGMGVDGPISVVRGTYDTSNDQVIENEDPYETTAKMMAAVRDFEARQAEMSLTASGGFCAPVTPDYSFCDLSDTNLDLFQASLPRVRTTRGRVQYMNTPTNDQFYDQWGGIYDNTFAGVGAYFDETASLAVDPDNSATWKGLVQVDCPTQQDPEELSAHYTNVYWKHFTYKAYPEYVDLFIRKALQAHQLKESISLYNRVVTQAESVAGISAVPNSVSGYFAALETQAAAYRDAFWLPRNQVLDTVQPRWVLNVLRIALTRGSQGTQDELAALQVADATINRLFASIGIRVNFVSGINRLAVSTDGAGNQVTPIVPSAGVNLWPDAVPVLMWVPGSVVLLDNPDWNIGIERLRDTTLQRQNAYTLFTETFSGLAWPCPYPIQHFPIDFCPLGERVERVTVNCAAVAGAAPSS